MWTLERPTLALAIIAGLAAVTLGGCQTVSDRVVSAFTSAAPEAPATVDCNASQDVLRYHMTSDQRHNLTKTLRNQGCAAD